jgi:hypothetical protein
MDGKTMANNEEELKKEVARLHRQYEAEIPRLTDLSVAVIGVFESNDASPTEVSAERRNRRSTRPAKKFVSSLMDRRTIQSQRRNTWKKKWPRKSAITAVR